MRSPNLLRTPSGPSAYYPEPALSPKLLTARCYVSLRQSRAAHPGQQQNASPAPGTAAGKATVRAEALSADASSRAASTVASLRAPDLLLPQCCPWLWPSLCL